MTMAPVVLSVTSLLGKAVASGRRTRPGPIALLDKDWDVNVVLQAVQASIEEVRGVYNINTYRSIDRRMRCSQQVVVLIMTMDCAVGW